MRDKKEIDDYLPWTEKYRPKRLNEVIGQEQIVKVMKAFVEKGTMPHLLFAGPPGVGKTTIAIAIAHELYKDQLAGNFLETNASDERGIDIIRGKIKEFSRSLTANDVGFKIIFLDEADALTQDAQHALRRTMEIFSKETRMILSCNYSSKIIEPIQSRTAIFRFSQLDEKDVEKMVKRIEKGENLKVSDEAIKALYYISEGDLRKVINILQGAAFIDKKIDEEIVYKIAGRASPKEVKELLKIAYEGRFNEARKMAEALMFQNGLSAEDILIQFYKELFHMQISDNEKAFIAEKIADYNFRIVEGANEKIQLDALLAQIGLARQLTKHSTKND
ncbi:MAG: replication factor C small subunit [Candidatus Anstonellales archaeon]